MAKTRRRAWRVVRSGCLAPAALTAPAAVAAIVALALITPAPRAEILEDAVPIVRRETLVSHPEVERAVEDLAGKISAEEMLNSSVNKRIGC